MREQLLEILLNENDFTSGEALSLRLGVSRTAIWKSINKLKDEGYEITSVRNRGYLLVKESEEVNEEGIKAHLSKTSRFKTVKVYKQLDSTMTESKRLKNSDAIGEGIIIAQEQTAGKGRRGNTWHSQQGEGLWLSYVLTPDIPPMKASMLTLVAGVAVMEAIEEMTNLKAMIKWPNDLVVNNKKVCGILTEMSAQIDYINYVVVGIGVNVNQQTMDDSIKDIGTSLQLECKEKVNRSALLNCLNEKFEKYYAEFLQEQSLDFIRYTYNQRCINIGMDLKILSYGEVDYGKGIGIDSEGALIVEGKDGNVYTVNAGEVSVRGLYGYVE